MMVNWLVKNDALLGIMAILMFLLLSVVSFLSGNLGFLDINEIPNSLTALTGTVFFEMEVLQALLVVLSSWAVIFQLHRILLSWSLLGSQSNIALLVAVLGFFCLSFSSNSIILWLEMTILMFIINQLFEIIEGDAVNRNVFNASFFTGILTLAHLYWALVGVWIIIAIAYSAKINSRVLILAATGIALPWYFLIMLSFIFPEKILFNAIIYPSQFNFSFPELRDLSQWVLAAVGGIAATLYNSAGMSSTTLRIRKKWQMVLLMFFSTLPLLFLGDNTMPAVLAFVPAVIAISKFLLSYPNKWIKELVFVLFLGLTIIHAVS